MGCYDMVFLEIECPYCKRTSEIEFQTKNMNKVFDTFRKGDKIPKGYNSLAYLDSIGNCHSPECQEKSDKSFIITQKSPSGFGLLFNAKVKLKNSEITGETFNIRKDKRDLDEYIEENRDKWEKIYKPRKKDDKVFRQFKEVK